jgi:uncharacterized protein (DUF885 family)
MNRRDFLTSASAVGVLATMPGIVRAQAGAAGDARLRQMLDGFFYARLADNPEGATALGLDTGERAKLKYQLSDASRAQSARELARSKRELAELRTVSREGLSADSRLDYDVVEYSLERAIEGERFDYGATGGRYAPYVLSQLSGAYRSTPDFLANQHRVRNADEADAYVARVEAFARVIDQETERQREDAAKGVFAPDYILDTALKQYATIRDVAPAQTGPVTDLAKKLKAANLPPQRAAAVEKLMGERVFPALDRQRALVSELRARAGHDAGVWRLPDGEAYYSAAASAATTVNMTGDEIHAMGLEQVAELEGRIDAILKREGMGQGSVGERLVALNQRPDQLFANTDEGREQLLALLREQVAEMQARLPEQFDRIPRAPIEVRRVPPAIEAGSAGAYYQAASLDGSRPGIYFINLRDTFDRPKFGLKTLSYHEGVPGHHFQVMLALESETIPLIRRRGGYSGYSEGWALYTEQLADEMGLYDGDPLGEVGYLQSMLFRATRLVVDSGLHAKRWSREKATDYFLATTGIARGRGQNEIDRYTVWPGQACSYKIGHTTWVRLRDEAKARQGERWNPKAFHRLLSLGALPLTVLERQVAERIV